MIAIPNMDKPKGCYYCQLEDNSICIPLDEFVEEINRETDCPLIDIVMCKDCKYSKIYALQSDAPMKRWCHKDHFPKEVTDGYYCGDGERRFDESI